MLTLLVVVILMLLDRHGCGHGSGRGGRHRVDIWVLVELVDLEMERVVGWEPHGWDWLGDRVVNRLWNGDGRGRDW